ncbi:MAG: 2'-5' RNA ligase family protein [Bacteroidetes bacterium]|nr:2'-5' RNA ligase family protein [Bacteroidota bacterium]MBS1539027.1 2'-5' RNA ligase family protein [Bacteroidota bacterium]
MKKSLPEGIAKYFLAIVPPSPVREEIQAMKEYISGKYNCQAALRSPPHITLHMPFQWKEKKEDVLCGTIALFSLGKKTLTLELSAFGAFEPRVLFIDVAENAMLHEFQHSLHRFCKIELNLFNAQYRELPFRPHLTVAFRDLKKEMFSLAWNEFQSKPFYNSFVVNGIWLLKHTGKVWLPYRFFPFEING